MKDQIEKKAKRLIRYKEPKLPAKRCSNCFYSYCWNPGAYIPSLLCEVLKKEMKKLDKNFHPHIINEVYGICSQYKKRINNQKK